MNERFEITLVGKPGEVPPVVRLRRFLKVALRSAGFRCVAARQIHPQDTTADGEPVATGPKHAK